jgi:glycosyltransferase involved in cell wall biosynthesis
MKVLVITNLFPNRREPNRGVFNLQQIEALKQYSEIRVISPIAWQPWVYGMHSPVPEERCWSDIPALYPRYFFTPRVGRAAYAMWMYCSLRSTVMRVVRQYQPDVILGTWAYPDAVAVAALTRRLEIPWAAKVHGSDINTHASAPSIRVQIRWALRQASRVFAVSAPLKQRLVEIGVPAEAVRVQHNGVNVERFRLQDKRSVRQALDLPLERRIVVYVGNLKVSKGTMDLAAAARMLAADGADMPLIVLAGDGPAHQLLTDTVGRHALSEHVRLVGARPHAEIPDWIAAADALCLPSHQEGCPNVVLEALASGRPVVACRVGAVPELLDEQCGFLVSPQQPAQLAAALKAAVSRDWDAAALRERVLPLSWAENGRILAEELEQAIQERRRAAASQNSGSTLPETHSLDDLATDRSSSGCR